MLVCPLHIEHPKQRDACAYVSLPKPVNPLGTIASGTSAPQQSWDMNAKATRKRAQAPEHCHAQPVPEAYNNQIERYGEVRKWSQVWEVRPQMHHNLQSEAIDNSGRNRDYTLTHKTKNQRVGQSITIKKTHLN